MKDLPTFETFESWMPSAANDRPRSGRRTFRLKRTKHLPLDIVEHSLSIDIAGQRRRIAAVCAEFETHIAHACRVARGVERNEQ